MTESARDKERQGFDLSADEHLEAEELIDELQDRIISLGNRHDSHLLTTCRPQVYEPTIYKVTIGDDKTVIKHRMSETHVSHNGKAVLDLKGSNIDMINFGGLTRAMTQIRQYMILDDLASI